MTETEHVEGISSADLKTDSSLDQNGSPSRETRNETNASPASSFLSADENLKEIEVKNAGLATITTTTTKNPMNRKSNDAGHGSRNKRSNGLYLPVPLDGGARGSLLKKLLEDEITAEESKLLQCLHYLRSQNYFGINVQ